MVAPRHVGDLRLHRLHARPGPARLGPRQGEGAPARAPVLRVQGAMAAPGEVGVREGLEVLGGGQGHLLCEDVLLRRQRGPERDGDAARVQGLQSGLHLGPQRVVQEGPGARAEGDGGKRREAQHHVVFAGHHRRTAQRLGAPGRRPRRWRPAVDVGHLVVRLRQPLTVVVRDAPAPHVLRHRGGALGARHGDAPWGVPGGQFLHRLWPRVERVHLRG
mmetsp:Transcript_73584/g.225060  ORF Transcript_73584/g.225060 Transcript_73584/m.225060 type:complete len:218 (-) Transcript_73584:1671-2324(-)